MNKLKHRVRGEGNIMDSVCIRLLSPPDLEKSISCLGGFRSQELGQGQEIRVLALAALQTNARKSMPLKSLKHFPLHGFGNKAYMIKSSTQIMRLLNQYYDNYIEHELVQQRTLQS